MGAASCRGSFSTRLEDSSGSSRRPACFPPLLLLPAGTGTEIFDTCYDPFRFLSFSFIYLFIFLYEKRFEDDHQRFAQSHAATPRGYDPHRLLPQRPRPLRPSGLHGGAEEQMRPALGP